MEKKGPMCVKWLHDYSRDGKVQKQTFRQLLAFNANPIELAPTQLHRVKVIRCTALDPPHYSHVILFQHELWTEQDRGHLISFSVNSHASIPYLFLSSFDCYGM